MSEELVEKIARALCCNGRCHMVEVNERAAIARDYPVPWSCVWQGQIDKARACLSAIEAEGYVVVPREPTAEMVDAMEPKAGELGRHWRREVYRAAIAAAPKQV